MPFMKQNVNFGLLLLIIATMFTFVGFTVYYQQTFEAISQDYNTQVSEIKKLVTTLQSEKSRLNQTSYQLKLKQEREVSLSESYDELNVVKEGLEQDKKTLTKNLLDTTASLNQANADIAAKDARIAELNEEVQDLDEDVSRWRNRYNDCDSALALCQG